MALAGVAADAAEAARGDVPPARRARLERLAAREFRNLARLDLVLPEAGVAIIGENGQGKTNLLEAVYYLQLLRSMRGARDQDLVRFGAAGFHVAARVHTDRAHDVGAGFDTRGRRKQVTTDGAVATRLSDALGSLPSVIWSPQDVGLVAGAPGERRRYLDVTLALTSRRYLAALQTYRGALARRNAALREALRSGHGAQRIAVWEPAIAEHGATLWIARRRWVARAAPEFARLVAAIGERGTAAMRYVTSLAPDDEADAASVAHALEASLARQRPHDVRRGVTHAGPHRDDLALSLAGAEGPPRELRAFGSAGQQRTAAIALRMLEAATLREASGYAPLFLLDDPFAELDARRAHRILALLGETGFGQTVLTVPRATDIPPELSRLERWAIADGVVRGAAS